MSVANTEEARDLIVNNQELFKDFEITKGKMDDVFLSVTGKKLVGVFQAIGIVLSVVVLTVIGIKYLMGSAEEKADYKKSLIPYVVGAALVFTASIFAQSIYEFFSGWGN